MMSTTGTMTRAELLALRRRHLVAECNFQRFELAAQAQPLQQSLTSAAIGMRIINRVRRHPGWIAALGLGLFIVKPMRVSNLLRLGTGSLRLFRQAAPLLQQLSAPREF